MFINYSVNNAKNLTVTYSRVRDIPGHSHRSLYDGVDSIYFLGGGPGYIDRDSVRILKYPLSNDTLISLGSFPLTARHGSLQRDPFGNSFYFEADMTLDDKVLKYSPSTNTTTIVGKLPYKIFCIPTLALDSNTFLILSRTEHGRKMVVFDLKEGFGRGIIRQSL